MSHPIRGIKGDKATREEMEANNRRACEFAAKVRQAYPSLELYCPGEHDEFVMAAYRRGLITEHEILGVDVDLLAQRDFLIVYAPESHISHGMAFEIRAAHAGHKVVVIVVGDDSLESIGAVLETFIR
jgi:hypothetical protein